MSKYRSFKGIARILILSLCVLLLSGCDDILYQAPAETATPTLHYSDANGDLEFDYPKTWDLKNGQTNGQNVTVVSSPSENAILSILDGAAPEGTPMFPELTEEQLDEFAGTGWNHYKAYFAGNFDIQGEPKVSMETIAGKKFASYQVGCTLTATSKEYLLRVYVGLYGGKIYCFLYGTETDAPPKVKDLLNDMVASIRIAVPEETPKPASKTQVYDNTGIGLQLQYPSEWKAIEKATANGSPNIMVMRPDGYQFFSIEILEDTTQTTPYDQCKEDEFDRIAAIDGAAMLAGLKTLFKIGDQPTFSAKEVNGRKYITTVFQAKTLNDYDVEVSAYSGFYFGKYYLFYTVNADSADASAPALAELVESLALSPPQ